MSRLNILSLRSAMLALACMTALGAAQAQNVPPPAPAPGTNSVKDDPVDAGRRNQKIENIHIEDSGAKIDEQRYGGQTQSITVTPKNNMPSYEVLPNSSGPNADGKGQTGVGGTGPAVWNVLKF
ncbi:hypothetical protein QTI66_15655 [Variovorax sp. J22R133]|uniref:hypothetical protein n=1 Tax=Variovorax brevis TaxID=3053503 RepID=UPI002574C4D0|nr:hypothetical protein [Variovorax sp. J22R133]MDM0113595.1 hypothetical protein [Variovorax sp. J22R133]